MIKLKDLWKQEGKLCYYCNCETHVHNHNLKGKVKGSAATREHLIPQVQGGLGRRINIKLACKDCNSSRSDMYAPDWKLIAQNSVTLQSYYKAKADKKIMVKNERYHKWQNRIKMKYNGFQLKIVEITELEFDKYFKKVG